MARVPSKHGRDQALDFQGFLNDLQDWELSLKDKDKKMKAQAGNRDNLKPSGRAPKADLLASSSGKSDFLTNYDALSKASSSFMAEDHLPDANSEKEQGNEYFKQKKYNEAIDCYSRSIALSPTAVAYANRAMAYLKIKRFREAEEDCTEALDLDDRYIKAYSRRATARKELRKLKESMDDAEFALRLEPNNQELKKQFADVKALFAKEILKKKSGAPGSSTEGVQQTVKPETKTNGSLAGPVTSSKQKAGTRIGEEVHNMEEDEGHNKKYVEDLQSQDRTSQSGAQRKEPEASHADAIQNSGLRNYASRKHELKPSMQELASRAASRAMIEASKNIKPPKTAYEFENSWRGFSGDRALQAQLLKVTSPSVLPQIFKHALTAPMLIDVIKCVATFFGGETDLAVKYLENLTKVPRFSMLIMCLSPAERADLKKLWDEVFCNEPTPIEYVETLGNLRSQYCLQL